MRLKILITLYIIYNIFISTACNIEAKPKTPPPTIDTLQQQPIKPAALLSEEYLPLLRNKRVALIANQTSQTADKHLLDFLLENNINVVKIFSPEHGFRGNKERNKSDNSKIDPKTKLPIIPMFGKQRKPLPKDLKDVDILLFDIQDVGVRFYTYISTMHLGMEAAAQNNLQFIVLDRPNPLGDYIDGCILQPKFKSFVGMHPIPIVHGLTVGELALMINGEGWLANGIKCNLKVIKCQNYNHSKKWSLAIKPSPNLPNDLSIRLYPSLCLFEATKVSIGRGTPYPFQVIGYPDSSLGSFSFIPKDLPGVQSNPVQENKRCFGEDLRTEKLSNKFTLKYIIKYNQALRYKGVKMITNPRWFNLLAGNDKLLSQIRQGKTEAQIKKSWQKDLEEYKQLRKKYLLYP